MGNKSLKKLLSPMLAVMLMFNTFTLTATAEGEPTNGNDPQQVDNDTLDNSDTSTDNTGNSGGKGSTNGGSDANGKADSTDTSDNQTTHEENDETPQTTVSVTGITVDPESLTLTVGDEPVTITAAIEPDNATNKDITWSSSNEEVATVDENGVVTAVAEGETTITATATNGTENDEDDKKATCAVTVNAATSLLLGVSPLLGTPSNEVAVASVTADGTTTEYTDFSGAINAWVDGSTLKLLKNIDTDSTIKISSGTKQLDLNNFVLEINAEEHAIELSDTSNLTIKDSSDNKNGAVQTSLPESGKTVVSLTGNSTLTLVGGKITNSARGVYLTDNSSFTMSGGNIAVKNTGVSALSNAVVSIKDGTITGSNYGLDIQNGASVDISGGSISNCSFGLNLAGKNSKANITGGSITATLYGIKISDGSGNRSVVQSGGIVSAETSYYLDGNTSSGSTEVLVKGGKVKGKISKAAENGIFNVILRGGVFDESSKKSEVDYTYVNLAEGCQWTENTGDDKGTYPWTITPTEQYALWIGGTQVTSANASNITGSNPVQASYEASTKTLTLNNFEYSGPGYIYPLHSEGIYGALPTLRINLIGINTITNTNTNVSYANGLFNSNIIEITGTGSLTCTRAQNTTSGYGIECRELTISNATVNTEAPNENGGGIHSDKVTINSGTLTTKGGFFGITRNSDSGTLIVEIKDGALTASASNTAINGTIKNAIAGTGWMDEEGTMDRANIEISDTARSLNYKKVQFPPAPVASITIGSATTEYTSFSSALGAWENGSTLKLLADVEIASEIAINTKTVTLDLNGYGILMTGNYGVFYIGQGATLSLYDNDNSSRTHFVTLNSWRGTAVSDTGPAQAVTDGSGVAQVTGGYITGGNVPNNYYGGGAFRVDGTFNMYGGTLLGNLAEHSGGAIWSVGTTTIAGDSRIMYNKGAENNRGGVYISSGTFNISGKPNLTGNRGCDIVLNGTNTNISFDTNTFNKEVRLGVVYITNDETRVFTTGANFSSDKEAQDAIQHFYPDRRVILRTEEGQAKVSSIEKYNLWVGGIQVTSANATNILGNRTASYNGNTNTLTLSGATINAGHQEQIGGAEYEFGIYYHGNDALNLKLANATSNSISINDSESKHVGIYSLAGLNISGYGDLIVSASGDSSDGIFARDGLTIAETKITVHATGNNSIGIYCQNGMTINSGTVEASGKTGIGVASNNNVINIIGGNVSAVSNGENGYAVFGRVKNSIAGTGWTDTAGTGPGTDIEINTTGQNLTYKKVQFPRVVYPLWVGGVQVTSENANNILGNNTASYDAESNTLTLNGATITNGYLDTGNTYGVFYEGTDALNVELSGENKIENTDFYAAVWSLKNRGTAVQISGTGTLTTSARAFGLYSFGPLTIKEGATVISNAAVGIFAAGDITIENSTVTGTGTSTSTGEPGGIWANAGLTITGSNVTASASGGSEGNFGIYANAAITITESTLKTTASGNNSAGINNYNNITINSSTVTAIGGKYGLISNNGGIRITNSNVTAIGSDVAYYEVSRGIEANQIFIISGTVTATGGANGIYADEGNIEIMSGTVTATGTINSGIATKTNDVIISGGTVNIKDSNTGIIATNNVDIQNGKVTVVGNDTGIWAQNGNVTISNGDVSATGKGGDGIYAANNVSITGGTVEAIGSGDDDNAGVYSNGVVTIGAEVKSFIATGTHGAFNANAKVKNAITGTGWKDTEGKTDAILIAVNSGEGQDLSTYKKAQFPALPVEYTVIGNKQEWTKGSSSNLTITFEGTYDADTFKNWVADGRKITVDGNAIKESSYAAEEGSLVIHLKQAYLEGLSVGNHKLSVSFKGYEKDVIANFTVKAKSSGGGSTPKKDNVVTCQMAGFPANYAWNEAAKACQPGYLDAGGNFHSYGTARRSNVPNTSDNGNLTFYTIAMFLMTFVAYITAKKLTEDSRA